MKKVNKITFELWVEINEHAPGVKVNSRISGDDFITEYVRSYDGAVMAKCISTDHGEIYMMAVR